MELDIPFYINSDNPSALPYTTTLTGLHLCDKADIYLGAVLDN